MSLDITRDIRRLTDVIEDVNVDDVNVTFPVFIRLGDVTHLQRRGSQRHA